MALILLIAGEAAMRQLLFCALASEHTIIEAGDGYEGLILCQLAQPDLIIVDLIVPSINGIDLVRVLRATSPNIRIIIQGNFSAPALRAQAFAAGADRCISRPPAIAELITIINDLLSLSP